MGTMNHSMRTEQATSAATTLEVGWLALLNEGTETLRAERR